METQDISILNDLTFWIELIVGGVAFILSFVVKGIRQNIEKLFAKTDQHGEDISSLKTDIKNLRGEFERSLK